MFLFYFIFLNSIATTSFHCPLYLFIFLVSKSIFFNLFFFPYNLLCDNLCHISVVQCPVDFFFFFFSSFIQPLHYCVFQSYFFDYYLATKLICSTPCSSILFDIIFIIITTDPINRQPLSYSSSIQLPQTVFVFQSFIFILETHSPSLLFFLYFPLL